MAAAPSGRAVSLSDPRKRILFIKPDEIDHIEAAGNYVRFCMLAKERHILPRKLTAAMEARLTSAGFMRISRSAIVNLGASFGEVPARWDRGNTASF